MQALPLGEVHELLGRKGLARLLFHLLANRVSDVDAVRGGGAVEHSRNHLQVVGAANGGARLTHKDAVLDARVFVRAKHNEDRGSISANEHALRESQSGEAKRKPARGFALENVRLAAPKRVAREHHGRRRTDARGGCLKASPGREGARKGGADVRLGGGHFKLKEFGNGE